METTAKEKLRKFMVHFLSEKAAFIADSCCSEAKVNRKKMAVGNPVVLVHSILGRCFNERSAQFVIETGQVVFPFQRALVRDLYDGFFVCLLRDLLPDVSWIPVRPKGLNEVSNAKRLHNSWLDSVELRDECQRCRCACAVAVFLNDSFFALLEQGLDVFLVTLGERFKLEGFRGCWGGLVLRGLRCPGGTFGS